MKYYFLDCENSGPFLTPWQPKCRQLGLYPFLSKILENLTHTLPPSSSGPKDLWLITVGDSPMRWPYQIPYIEAHSLQSPHDKLLISCLSKTTTVFHFKPHLTF